MAGYESVCRQGRQRESSGSEDGNFTHRSEARGGVIYVWGVKAIVCWRRVLRHERRWTTVWTTVRGGPASRLRLLDVGQIGPAVASPAKGEQAEYHDEENDDWNESSNCRQWWVGNGRDRYVQNARPIRARARSLSPSQVS
jgi:hypothetical protein